MKNAIKPNGKTVVVELDAEDLLTKPAYTRDGTRMFKSGLTIQHVIQGLAIAYVIMKAPHLMRRFAAARTVFEGGRYIVTLSEDVVEILSDVGKA